MNVRRPRCQLCSFRVRTGIPMHLRVVPRPRCQLCSFRVRTGSGGHFLCLGRKDDLPGCLLLAVQLFIEIILA